MLRVIAALLLIVSSVLAPLQANAVPAADQVEPEISEIYPNPPEAPETGFEYVELYNPNETVLTVDGYSIRLKGKTSSLELAGEIEPGGYKALITPFALTNTGATVQLYVPASGELPEVIIDEVTYTEVKDDQLSWQKHAEDWILAVATPNTGPPQTEEAATGPDDEIEPIIYLPIDITELLPNPAQPLNDNEYEFIELYNPNPEAVNLDGYVLKTGASLNYQFVIPAINIGPGEYAALYSSESKLVLSNTAGKAALFAPDGTLLSETASYEEADDDAAWALTGGAWQYTLTPTPGSANKLKLPEVETASLGSSGGTTSTLKPCGPGQERNPATNRCRKISSASITSLKPCGPGESRNPATNRCRKNSTTASTLKPCVPGQERNPATNRCRKISSSVLGASIQKENAKEPDTVKPLNLSGYWLLGIVGAGALAYGAYEWRGELAKSFGRIRSKITWPKQ